MHVPLNKQSLKRIHFRICLILLLAFFYCYGPGEGKRFSSERFSLDDVQIKLK